MAVLHGTKNNFLVTVVMSGSVSGEELPSYFFVVVGWFIAFRSRPEISQVQFLDGGLFLPVVMQDRCLVQTVQKPRSSCMQFWTRL